MGEIAIKEKNALAQYELTPARIAEMAKEYMSLTVAVGDKVEYMVARKALTICVTARTGTDKRRKELGERLRKELSDINSVGKQLIAALAPAEEHLRNEIGAEDNRLNEIKAEKERRELARIEGIMEKIAGITSLGASLHFNLEMPVLKDLLAEVDSIEITPYEYMELTKEANQAKHDVHISLHQAIEAREKFDAEEANRKAEDERLAKERAELDKIRAEQQAVAEMQAKKETTIEAAKNRVAAKIQRDAFERQAKENATVQAEKDAKAKVYLEAWEKKEKEKEEAEEKKRKEALEPDQSKLRYWLERIEIDIGETPEMIGQEAKLLVINGIAWFDAVISDIRVSIEDL